MSDQTSEATDASLTRRSERVDAPSRERGGRRAHRTDWRLGGRSVRTWRAMRAEWAVLSLGAGVVAGFAIVSLWPTSPWVGLASTGILWVAMLGPTVAAFATSRPVGLLRLRWLDLLYGVALGLLLRLFQGWVAQVSGGGAEFPTFLLFDGGIPVSWWWTEALPAAVVAPVIEEFFFRAVLLVSIFTALRRRFGHFTAGLAAFLVTTALFILVHAVGGPITADAVVALGAVGATCALLVLLTGRIWAAVLVHIVYNTTYLALGLVGTALA